MSSNSNHPIKILKRQPNTNTAGDGINRSTAATKPRKTLEEREAAYAEARRRILGASPPPPSSPEENTELSPTVVLPCTTAPTPVATTLTMPTIVAQQRLMAPQSISHVGRNLFDFNRAVFISQGMQRYPAHFINQHHQPPQPFYYYYQ